MTALAERSLGAARAQSLRERGLPIRGVDGPAVREVRYCLNCADLKYEIRIVPGYPDFQEFGQGSDADSLHVFANLADYNVYTTLNAKNQFRAPTEFGVFLRPAGSASESSSEESGSRCLACESERSRGCWVAVMRLAKYGKQLRENYRAFKNKQVEPNSPKEYKEYNSYTVPNESVRSRVAMDFTGSVGRIVEDPKEAKAIAVAEGYSWKRRWRPTARLSSAAGCHLQGLESGVHITQPWFHSGMSRDQAAALINRHGTVDGVFLIRESRSSPGSYVLTFKCGTKVLHTQIQPVMDPVREALCYTLDRGVTKFYDLLQLVEFYQLNAGCLPTRLTSYVVQSPSGLHLLNRTPGNQSPSSS